jgi:hypothetical protein
MKFKILQYNDSGPNISPTALEAGSFGKFGCPMKKSEKAPRSLHCKENPNYVFLFWELRGLSPNFHIHVPVSDLNIPRICPHISLLQNRQTDPGNI